MLPMKEIELTPEQRSKYNELLAEMRAELELLPKSDGNILSCTVGNRPYKPEISAEVKGNSERVNTTSQ